MKKDNIEALKSSVLVGLAYGAIVGGVLLANGKSYALLCGAIAIVVGFGIGVLTTWYPDEE